jgi:hypothetical protein
MSKKTPQKASSRTKMVDHWPAIERLSKAAKNKPITANDLAKVTGVSSRRALVVLNHFADNKKLKAEKIIREGVPGNYPIGFVRR